MEIRGIFPPARRPRIDFGAPTVMLCVEAPTEGSTHSIPFAFTDGNRIAEAVVPARTPSLPGGFPSEPPNEDDTDVWTWSLRDCWHEAQDTSDPNAATLAWQEAQDTIGSFLRHSNLSASESAYRGVRYRILATGVQQSAHAWWGFIEAHSPPGGLEELLDELGEVAEDALEQDFPQPTELARSNAERLLKEMFEILPRRYEIYPTQDGEIVIDVPNRKGSSVVLLCDSEGGALCLVGVVGVSNQSKSYTSEEFNQLPDDFLRGALLQLKEATDGWFW